MEVYILDSLLRRDTVVDVFESLIWTERFADIGDFELVIHSTPSNRRLFSNGMKLAVNESYRVMSVETIEDTNDSDGREMIKIKGRSIETLFEDRVLLGRLSPYTFQTYWFGSGLPADIMMQMFYDCCVNEEIDANDPIPFWTAGTLYPLDGIPFPDQSIILEAPAASLLNSLQDLAKIYDLGFRLYRNPDTNELYFDIYSGSDRTNLQSDFPAVVFSPQLENLQNIKSLSSVEKIKNVAYVLFEREVDDVTQTFQQVVYPDGIDPTTVQGFDRHAIYVEVTSLPEEITDPDIPAYLIRQGKDALSKARPFAVLDGEISQYSEYTYEIDYFLGDLVTMQNKDGITNSMRVTEQIFVHDAEGERSYPTLELRKFIEPGNWSAWNYTKTWADMGTEEFWTNQP